MNKYYPEFRNQALCATGILHPDIWFDYELKNSGSVQHTEASKLARKICMDCPALEECRKYAMQYSNLWGIWGGMDHIERKKIQDASGARVIDFTLSYPNATQPNREIGTGRTMKITNE